MLHSVPFALCTACAGELQPRQVVSVPRGSAVMIDGRISPGEWSDAKRIVLANGATLYVKQHEHYLLLAIVFPSGKYGFTDLFVNGDLDLHASAKLGERKRQPDGTWSRRDWWNNDRWAANVSRMEKFDGPELMREKRP